MKTKKTETVDELRMKQEDFDRIMRNALGVSPEEKAKPKSHSQRKKATLLRRKDRK